MFHFALEMEEKGLTPRQWEGGDVGYRRIAWLTTTAIEELDYHHY